jgi:hypothetical protein
MRKKISIILLSLYFMVLALPFMAFAATNYSGGFLDGVSMHLGSDQNNSANGTTLLATDNNEASGLSVYTMTNGNTLWAVLTTDQDLSSYILNATGSTMYQLDFYNAAGGALYSINSSTLLNDSIKHSFPVVNGVHKVALRNLSTTVVATVNEINVFNMVPDTTAPANVTGLTETHTDTTATLSFTKPIDTDFNGFKLYKNNVYVTNIGKTISTYTDSGLTASTAYTYKITSVDVTGNESLGSSITVTTSAVPDTIPPNAVTGVSAGSGDGTATLTWLAVSDPSLAGYNVYESLDNLTYTKINTSVITATNYIVSSLTNGTLYYFKLTALDMASNESVKSASVSARPVIAPQPPLAPLGLGVKVMDSDLLLSWSAVSGASGYNVYMNDIKVNSTALSSTSYNAPSLTNGTDYKIEVTAINAAGESPKSASIHGTPSASALPYISFSYSLKDVADGVSNWFGSYWMILAFSIAIPLSFYVGSRIKSLFI